MARGRIFQSKQKEIDALIWQLKAINVPRYNFPITTPIKLFVSLYGDDRKDFLGQLETIGDILQDSGIIKNDRQIKNIVAKKEVKRNHMVIIKVDF